MSGLKLPQERFSRRFLSMHAENAFLSYYDLLSKTPRFLNYLPASAILLAVLFEVIFLFAGRAGTIGSEIDVIVMMCSYAAGFFILFVMGRIGFRETTLVIMATLMVACLSILFTLRLGLSTSSMPSIQQRINMRCAVSIIFGITSNSALLFFRVKSMTLRIICSGIQFLSLGASVSYIAFSSDSDFFTFALFMVVVSFLISLIIAYIFVGAIRRNFCLLLESHMKRMCTRKESDIFQVLLGSALPCSIAERFLAIIAKEKNDKEISLSPTKRELIADFRNDSVIIFAELSGLDDMRSEQETLSILSEVFTLCDVAAKRNGIEKIKSVGPVVIMASGVISGKPLHLNSVIACSEILSSFIQLQKISSHKEISKLSMRVGIASGPVVSGVVGFQKPKYDIWGDTVNMSARMMQCSNPGKGMITKPVYVQVCKEMESISFPTFSLTLRPHTLVKGVGDIEVFELSPLEQVDQLVFSSSFQVDSTNTRSSVDGQSKSTSSIDGEIFSAVNPEQIVKKILHGSRMCAVGDGDVESALSDSRPSTSLSLSTQNSLRAQIILESDEITIEDAVSSITDSEGLLQSDEQILLPFLRFKSSSEEKNYMKSHMSDTRRLILVMLTCLTVVYIAWVAFGILTLSPIEVLDGICGSVAYPITTLLTFFIGKKYPYFQAHIFMGGLFLLLLAVSIVLYLQLVIDGMMTTFFAIFAAVSLSAIPFKFTSLFNVLSHATIIGLYFYPSYGAESFCWMAFTTIFSWINFQLDLSYRRAYLLSQALVKNTLQLEEGKKQTSLLLQSIIPGPILQVLIKEKDLSVYANKVKSATILFADIVGFTPLCSTLSPSNVIELLDKLFSKFDEITSVHGLERLKTIGDAYVVVGNIQNDCENHPQRVVDLALSISKFISEPNDLPIPISMRIGVHTGPLIAGVIASETIVFDAWGKSLKYAEMIESKAPPNGVLISKETAMLIHPEKRSQFVERVVDMEGISTTTFVI
eukprot:TRINITY_DN3248_c0_g1_i2.p1 TRINITY_DN3248_c0_g1~~TRINITY_DN3248_c0_g1_i2.p1  ORF type:complete len:995 (-),score=185.94 TRINITY_DN3248_c0_g1_i2:52-3009(-)